MTHLHVVPSLVEPIEHIGYACAPFIDKPTELALVDERFKNDEDVFSIFRLAPGFTTVTSIELEGKKNHLGVAIEEAARVLEHLGGKHIEELESELHHQKFRLNHLIGLVAKVFGANINHDAPIELLYEAVTLYLEEKLESQEHQHHHHHG